MIINLPYSYHVEILKKRCRKTETFQCFDFIPVEIKDEDCPVFMRVMNNEGGQEYRNHNGTIISSLSGIRTNTAPMESFPFETELHMSKVISPEELKNITDEFKTTYDAYFANPTNSNLVKLRQQSEFLRQFGVHYRLDMENLNDYINVKRIISSTQDFDYKKALDVAKHLVNINGAMYSKQSPPGMIININNSSSIHVEMNGNLINSDSLMRYSAVFGLNELDACLEFNHLLKQQKDETLKIQFGQHMPRVFGPDIFGNQHIAIIDKIPGHTEYFLNSIVNYLQTVVRNNSYMEIDNHFKQVIFDICKPVSLEDIENLRLQCGQSDKLIKTLLDATISAYNYGERCKHEGRQANYIGDGMILHKDFHTPSLRIK